MEKFDEIKQEIKELKNILETILEIQKTTAETIRSDNKQTSDILEKIANTITYICNLLA